MTTPTPGVQWMVQSQLVGRLKRGARSLGIALGQRPGDPPDAPWFVMAIEAPSDAKTLEGVLDAHAHQVIGTYLTLDAAMRAAESYARTWAKSRKRSKRCECEPIGAQSAARRRRARR